MPANVTVAQADYGVPHVKYTSTPDGFEVKYRRMPRALYALLIVGAIFVLAAYVAIISATNFFVGTLLFAALVYGLWKLIPMTHIRVDGDYVTINKKAMSRDDFSTFHIYRTATISDNKGRSAQFTVLGYTFGNRAFSLPGTFSEMQANEISAGLNRHLERTPRSGVQQASPDLLRETRPTDF